MNLTKCFDHHFQIVTPDSEALRKETARLRYMVYCVENKLAEPKDDADNTETDRYDPYAVHRLIQHKHSGVIVAGVRLILADALGRWRKLPIETYLSQGLYKNGMNPLEPERGSLAEISRFMISKQRMRQMTENMLDDIDRKDTDGSFLPPVALGLFKAILDMAMENNIAYYYAFLEPSLLRLLGRFGIRFRPIGPLADFHGKRLPCFRGLAPLLSGIYDTHPKIWHFLMRDPQGLPLKINEEQYRFHEVS